MTQNLSKPVITFYSILLLLLFGQVISTIYQGSISLYYRHSLSQIEYQKQQLIAENQKLKQQLSDQMSLTQLKLNIDLSDYEPINQPLVITIPNASLASTE